MQEFLFSYDDICLQPRHSVLKSRDEADTSVELVIGHKFALPVIPANMVDVISIENARQLAKDGYFYIMHRFGNATQDAIDSDLDSTLLSISIGVKDEDKRMLDKLVLTPAFITVDVAHADHDNTKDMLNYLYKTFRCMSYEDRPKFIVGNVGTADGYKFLCDSGADVVKVGIGGGSICTTRYKTGFHIPTAYSVWSCRQDPKYEVPIIADGGAKHFGDVAKALVLGANMVMSGRWFAECIDSPAKIEHGKKIYRGSTSYEAKGNNTHVEGQTIEIERACTYKERLLEIKQALQSSISYAGGRNLSAFNYVKWHLCNRP
jgi:GMP reductase